VDVDRLLPMVDRQHIDYPAAEAAMTFEWELVVCRQMAVAGRGPCVDIASVEVAVAGSADAVCQTFFEQTPGKKYDYMRTLKMTLVGSLMSAPMSHLWYCKYASNLTTKITMKPKLQPFVSLGFDQLMYTPFSLSLWLYVNGYIKDFSSLKAIKNVKERFWAGMKANWKVWPPIILVNFALIPPPLRVLFVNAFGFFWSIYLSHLQNN